MPEIASTGLAVLAVAGTLLSTGGGSATPDDATLAAATPPACARTAGPAPSQPGRRPSLLILHAGGFIFPVGEAIEPACVLATKAGFDVVYVNYPLGNMPKAVAAAERAAKHAGRHGQPVYAYGESAGGTMAALLAQQGLVEAAATYSQVTDLVGYYSRTPDPKQYKAVVGATSKDLRTFSPGLHDGGQPILAMVAADDDPALNRATRSWDRRESNVKSIEVEGEHIGTGDPQIYEENVMEALRWLQEQR